MPRAPAVAASSSTASAASSSASIEIDRPTPSASAGVAAATAPAATSASTASADRFHTCTSWPASTSRRAMTEPMVPRPRNPILIPMTPSRLPRSPRLSHAPITPIILLHSTPPPPPRGMTHRSRAARRSSPVASVTEWVVGVGEARHRWRPAASSAAATSARPAGSRPRTGRGRMPGATMPRSSATAAVTR